MDSGRKWMWCIEIQYINYLLHEIEMLTSTTYRIWQKNVFLITVYLDAVNNFLILMKLYYKHL